MNLPKGIKCAMDAPLSASLVSGNFFRQKSTIGTTIPAIGANNDTYCLQKRIESLTILGSIKLPPASKNITA